MKRELRLPLTATGRLDRAVADALGVGRAAVKQAFHDGGVRLRGRRARASDPAAPGALVQIELPEVAGAPEPEPELPLRVLVETPRCIVVDKPAGIATHPLLGGEGGTLANAVVARFPECADASPDRREGGAVQRLDVETSGCVAFARDADAWEELREQFARRSVEKVYLAVVLGRVTAGGTCSLPLAQRGGRVVVAADPERVPRGAGRPREALTHYEVVRPLPRHTLLEVRIVTGVMHQIRAHLAALGHPVVGDVLYGGDAAAVHGLLRHALHAARLGIDVPGGARVVAESPLPAELQRLVATLAE